ncbi:non-oxidative hydroxyarylic acid decarboxylases subunit D [Streptomyces sp. NPDC003077]|uniref:non-oxidative hydroxyarylic acid decarboxylases subunit D n=1 Tax=Streptomyces sp. NPDC003077 TaxID=3154443 RepID=UPI0033BBCA62
MTTCPRCPADQTFRVATAPVGAVWEVRQCGRCWYTWRSTEPAARRDPGHFPADFRMSPQTIAEAPQMPAVPPLAPGVAERGLPSSSSPGADPSGKPSPERAERPAPGAGHQEGRS